MKYFLFILLGALSLTKESDGLRNVYFEKAIQIIQMEEYPEIEFGSVDVNEIEKIGKKIRFFVITVLLFIILFLEYIALYNLVFYMTCYYTKCCMLLHC